MTTSSTFSRAWKLFGVLALLGSVPAGAWANDIDWPDLAELGSIEITTVSRNPESVWSSPAAVTVVTSEDIERVGATSIPEALRWVPGLNVAQINSNTWAIGARGFQWQFANKLLVMIDGRVVYSPTSGGVRWEDNTTFLDDIDRIEVVRGPGSSVWGANAVNGVINIVSRSAFDTLGTHVFAAAGDQLSFGTGVRQGTKLAENAALRVYGQYRIIDDNILPGGAPGKDGSHLGQGGFRLDWKPFATDSLTLQGDAYAQNTEYVRTFTTLAAPPTYAFVSDTPIRSHGANLLGRWRHEFSNVTYLEGQSYCDRVYRDRPQETERLTTMDASLTGGTQLGGRHEITAGLGYRYIDGHRTPKLYDYTTAGLQTHLFSAFAQDQITLVPGRWTATMGLRLEHNSFTGWEPQPTARLAFTPSQNVVLWGSLARAVRTPTWSEETSAADLRVSPPGGFDPVLPAAVHVLGNPDLQAEKLTSFEMGARWKISDRVSLDAAVFSYRYTDYVLVTFTGNTTQTSPPAILRNSQFQNGIKGESYGGELALRWAPTNWWQLYATYSYVNIQLHTFLSDPFEFEQDETTTPDNTVLLQSAFRLGRKWEFNLAGRYVDPVPYYSIPSYCELDTRLTWKPGEHWRVSLVGRNLLHDQHLEYDSALSRRLTSLKRSVFLIVRTDF